MAHVLEIMRDEVHDYQDASSGVNWSAQRSGKAVQNTSNVSSALMGATQTRAVAYAMAVLERFGNYGSHCCGSTTARSFWRCTKSLISL